MPEFVVEGNQLRFGSAFVELPAAESYCDAPREVVDAARSLLDADLIDTVAKVVHDAVTITIGANVLPSSASSAAAAEGPCSSSGACTTDVPPSWRRAALGG